MSNRYSVRNKVIANCYHVLNNILLVPHKEQRRGLGPDEFIGSEYDVRNGQLLHINRFDVQHTRGLIVALKEEVARVIEKGVAGELAERRNEFS